MYKENIEVIERSRNPGFKQTEVGLIPEDWNVAKLGEECIAYSGGTPNTGNKSFYDGNIPWISSSELNKKRINETDRFISELGLHSSSAKIVPQGTFLLAMYGATAGVSAITNISGAINQAVLAISSDNILPEFLFNYFSLRKDYIIQTYCQGGQPNLSGSIVKSIKIPLPPTLAEQKAIATALSDVDELISSLDALIAKKKAIKQGAMQQLLTPPHKACTERSRSSGKRLDGFDGEWVEKSLGEIFTFKQGLQCAIDEQFESQNNERVRFIRIVDLTNNDEPPRYISKPDASHLIDFNDLFMVRYGTPGLLGFGYKGVIANNLFRLIPRIKLNTKFFYHLLKYKNQDILNLSSSTTMAAISFGPLNQMAIKFPSDISKQKAIAQILSDMDKELEALATKKEKYEHIKQGMMQELLMGKTRLV